MEPFFADVIDAGVVTTGDQVYALGMYIPAMCDLKAQNGVSDDEAAGYLPGDLEATYGPMSSNEAATVVAAAMRSVCQS